MRDTAQEQAIYNQEREETMNKPKPTSPFEGWVMAKIEGVEKNLTNHLAHHWAVEVILVGAIVGLVIKVFCKIGG